MARLPNASPLATNWEAVSILERALLVANDDALRWTYLARFHRELDNSACALEATAKALSLAAENLEALDERAAILSDVGASSEALDVIEIRRGLDSESNVWLDVLKAFNLLFTGPLPEVLALTTTSIVADPAELWYLEVRATCYRMMQQWQLAADDSARIWNVYQLHDATRRPTFAWAADHLEDFSTARSLFHEVAADPTQSATAHRGIGLCALALGDWDLARHHLTLGIAEAREVRELEGLLRDDFPFAEHLAESRSDLATVRDLVRELTQLIERRQERLRAPRSVEAELQLVIGDVETSPTDADWPWIGAHAGLARVHAAAELWTTAAEIYQLLKTTGRFPEADLGIAAAVEKLTEQSREQLRDGEYRRSCRASTRRVGVRRRGGASPATW